MLTVGSPPLVRLDGKLDPAPGTMPIVELSTMQTVIATLLDSINGIGVIAQIGAALAQSIHERNQFLASLDNLVRMQVEQLKKASLLRHEASEHA